MLDVLQNDHLQENIFKSRELQGLYRKFRESGYRAGTMHFPPVFVTGLEGVIC